MISNQEINDLYETGQKRNTIEIGRAKLPNIANLYGDSGRLIFSTEHYRQSPTWNTTQKSRLIESLIINIPIGLLVLISLEKSVDSEIIDGEQRIKTIVDFFGNNFKLKGLQAWKELNGMTYRELPSLIKDALDRHRLETKTILIDIDSRFDRDAMKETTYKRLNSWRLT
jgi:Protein of unknown function DUF262